MEQISLLDWQNPPELMQPAIPTGEACSLFPGFQPFQPGRPDPSHKPPTQPAVSRISRKSTPRKNRKSTPREAGWDQESDTNPDKYVIAWWDSRAAFYLQLITKLEHSTKPWIQTEINRLHKLRQEALAKIEVLKND